MSVENRAKQFAPFAAVTGLDRALAEKLRELGYTDRRLLSEESAAELDGKLRQLRKGMRVSVRYYRDREYHSLSGEVERIEESEGFFRLGGLCIPFQDVEELRFSEELPFL